MADAEVRWLAYVTIGFSVKKFYISSPAMKSDSLCPTIAFRSDTEQKFECWFHIDYLKYHEGYNLQYRKMHLNNAILTVNV